MNKSIIFLMSLGLIVAVTISACGVNIGHKNSRPNFLVIISDDQRYDNTMQYMPKTQELIFDQGVTFSHAYITTPLCCPSRSSIFTGMYAHNHGVLDNGMKLNFETFINALHKNGYYTGLVGKYLNSWNGEKRPEFDYWVSYANGETRYNNPNLNVNGTWKRFQGQYVTYVLGNYVQEFLNIAAKKNQPYVLIYAANAPHDPVTPADEDKGKLKDLPAYRPPSFNEADMSDKPQWMAQKPLLSEAEIAGVDTFRRNQDLTLISLDRAVDKVISTLAETKTLDKTMIFYISDNGMHYGEHRLTSKNTYYEEAVRVPFAIRYPPLIPKPYTDNRIVANIDIAPTLYELAGLPIPKTVDGLSLTGLFKPGITWREGVLLEGWPPRGVYTAIHTEQYLYAETVGDIAELYDLKTDPYELTNLAKNPAYQGIKDHLKSLLDIEVQDSTHP
jgi:N-acetylglucosamine-6-sulfatase